MANDNRRIEFITPRHPLVRGMVEYIKQNGGVAEPATDGLNPIDAEAALRSMRMLPCPSLCLHTQEVAAGSYLVYLFHVMTRSIVKDIRLISIAVSTADASPRHAFGESFVRLLHEGHSKDFEADPLPPERIDELDSTAFGAISAYCDLRRQEVSRLNESHVSQRLDTVRRTRDILLRQVDQALARATDERIRRMKEGQRRRIQLKYIDDVRRIEDDRNVSVEFELAAVCRVEVVRATC